MLYSQPSISIDSIEESEDYGSFFVDGVDEQLRSSATWKEHFKVYVNESTLAMFGKYSLKGDRLVFRPDYLPDSKVNYRSEFLDIDGVLITRLFKFSEKINNAL